MIIFPEEVRNGGCQCACNFCPALLSRSFRCCALTHMRKCVTKAPQTGARKRCPIAELASKFPRACLLPLVSQNEGAVSGLNAPDGRAALTIYSRPNDKRKYAATYLRHNLRMDRAALDYVRIARSFFAISSERDGIIFYSRFNKEAMPPVRDPLL